MTDSAAAPLPWWCAPLGFVLFVIVPLVLFHAWPTISAPQPPSGGRETPGCQRECARLHSADDRAATTAQSAGKVGTKK